MKGFSVLERIAAGAKRVIRPLVIPLTLALGAGVLYSACSPKGEDTSPVAISGSASDGPYIDGSKVTIVQLDSDFVPTDSTIIQWTDSLGRYSAELPPRKNFKASISGYHFDEIAGQPSEAPIELLAAFGTGTAPDEYNINDVTQLVADRILHLAESDPGRSFSEYSTQARDELFTELDMILGSPTCHPHEMDVISGPDDCNDFLLAVELLFRQYAHDVSASTGAAVAPALQEVFNSSALYFGQTGTLPTDVLEGLRAAALNLDVEAATDNLQVYLDAQGESATAPDADNVLDQDMDGEVNATDPAPLDPDIYTGNCDNDGDGFDSLVCGGDDCDDDCPTCHPGAPEFCGEARDHDCDGLVDELEGCGDCEVGSPALVSQLTLESEARSLYVLENIVLINSNTGLQLFDTASPSDISVIGELPIENLESIAIFGAIAYLTGSGGNLSLADISSYYSPTMITSIPSIGGSQPNILVHPAEERIYSASSGGISIIDISEPSSPVLTAPPIEDWGMNHANRITLDGENIFVADDSGLYLLHRSDQYLSLSSGPLETGVSNDVAVTGDYAFVASREGLYVVNAASPDSPYIAGQQMEGTAVRRMFLKGNSLFALTLSSLEVFDITTPESPVLNAQIPIGSGETNNLDVFVTSSSAYVIDSFAESNLYVIDLDCR